MDPRITRHAELIVNYSTKTKEGDNVLIQLTDCGMELAKEVYRLSFERGASPLILVTPTESTRQYYVLVKTEFLNLMPKHLLALVKASDVVISIRGESNPKSFSNVDSKRISLRQAALKEISEERLSKRWCLTQTPSEGYAQEAEMSLSEYEDFLYASILRDWDEERTRMKKLADILNKGSTVRIVGKKTDLSLSIAGRTAVVGDITHNVPGGEVFTAPIDDSAEGEVYFDFPAISYGQEVQDVRLRFHQGEVVDFSAGKNEALLKNMIETDNGARRLGELGIGTNYGITRFTKNILFDEKIGGTIHLALGRAYKECRGTNDSAIHWDLVKSMIGGEIILDDIIIQKDGQFNWNTFV